MKLDNPRKHEQGCIHQTWHHRLTNDAAGRLLLRLYLPSALQLRKPAFFHASQLPGTFQRLSKPSLQYLQQCSRDNRSAVNRSWLLPIQFTDSLSQLWQKNVTRTGTCRFPFT